MIASGYSLDLYCDHKEGNHRYSEFPHNFFAEEGREARNMARKAGWKFSILSNLAICPRCAKTGITLKSLR